MHYRLRTSLILSTSTIIFAVLGGSYGYAAGMAMWPPGNVPFSVVACSVIGGLIGLAIGAAVWAVATYGFHFSIRDLLWLMVVALAASWFVHLAREAEMRAAIRELQGTNYYLQGELKNFQEWYHHAAMELQRTKQPKNSN